MRSRSLRKLQLSVLAMSLAVVPLIPVDATAPAEAITRPVPPAAGTAPSAAGRVTQRTAPPSAVPSAVPVPAAARPKIVYLTFDDGPKAGYTEQILKVLAAHGIQATFFVTGAQVKAHPDITRRIHLQGHSVQNHTWSHPRLTRVSAARFRSEITGTDRAIRARTGYTPRCLRPPYGAYDGTVTARAAALGKKLRLWTVRPAGLGPAGDPDHREPGAERRPARSDRPAPRRRRRPQPDGGSAAQDHHHAQGTGLCVPPRVVRVDRTDRAGTPRAPSGATGLRTAARETPPPRHRAGCRAAGGVRTVPRKAPGPKAPAARRLSRWGG
ncbi:polysaccharide deacetylase family protein [Streptomyces sp. NPDC004609]|uniref:polysaccharide deacetylase family protein n=1 Tax=Streptomyces sp. NPDC004609 TaxID=3364704 RepID=UPI0036ADDC12